MFVGWDIGRSTTYTKLRLPGYLRIPNRAGPRSIAFGFWADADRGVAPATGLQASASVTTITSTCLFLGPMLHVALSITPARLMAANSSDIRQIRSYRALFHVFEGAMPSVRNEAGARSMPNQRGGFFRDGERRLNYQIAALIEYRCGFLPFGRRALST